MNRIDSDHPLDICQNAISRNPDEEALPYQCTWPAVSFLLRRMTGGRIWSVAATLGVLLPES
jgi:hypothetical protein